MWYHVINDAITSTSLARPKLPGVSNCTDAQLLAAHVTAPRPKWIDDSLKLNTAIK